MNSNRDLFEKTSVPKAVALMAIPTIVTMLVVVIYNMADTFFIGQTGDAMQVAQSLLQHLYLWCLWRSAISSGSAEVPRSHVHLVKKMSSVRDTFLPFAAMVLWASGY